MGAEGIRAEWLLVEGGEGGVAATRGIHWSDEPGVASEVARGMRGEDKGAVQGKRMDGVVGGESRRVDIHVRKLKYTSRRE